MSGIVTLGILATESRSEVGDPLPVEPSSNWPIISLGLGAVIIAIVIGTAAMRLKNAPRNAWALTAGGSFLLFVGLSLFGSVGGTMMARLLSVPQGDESMKGKVIVAAGAFLTQLAILLMFRRTPRGGSRTLVASAVEALGTSQFAPANAFLPAWGIQRAIWFGALVLGIAWFPLQAVGSAVASIQFYFGGLEPPSEGHSTFELLRNSHDMLLNGAMVVIVIICAPITEEFTFRGAMQMGIRSSGIRAWWAIVATSALFAAIHIPVLAEGALASGLATLFMLAVILGWLMERTGRIAAPIAAHALFNLANLCLFWFA